MLIEEMTWNNLGLPGSMCPLTEHFWYTGSCVPCKRKLKYQYYVSGHYPSSCLYLKTVLFIFSKHNVSETGFYLRLQVKPTQLGPINRASPYLRTRRWIMSKNIILGLMYHRHKLLENEYSQSFAILEFCPPHIRICLFSGIFSVYLLLISLPINKLRRFVNVQSVKIHYRGFPKQMYSVTCYTCI
jgi:hypothetical protein